MDPKIEDLKAIAQLAKQTAFYAQRGEVLDRLETLADLRALPFSTKEDFRADFSRFLTGEPASRVHCTSGSTGQPAMVLYSINEMMSITRRAIETMRLAGVRTSHRVLNLFGYGTFIAGNLYDWGATAIGALVIPLGSAAMTPPALAARAIAALAPEVINGVPSYLRRFLGDLRREDWPNLDRIQIIQCAGEVLTPGLRQRLAETCGQAEIFDQYGMTEFGPLAAECSAHDGLHLLPDGLWFEIIDDDGNEVTDGEGDLTVTSLQNRAMVLLRYRTGDRVAVQSGSCPCGRGGRRIQVLRRSDDLTKIRGVLCSKNEIIDAIRSVAGVSQFAVTISRDDNDADHLDVAVAAGKENGDGAEAIGAAVRQALRDRIRIGPDSVEVLQDLEVPRTVSGKPSHILDERERNHASSGNGRQRLAS